MTDPQPHVFNAAFAAIRSAIPTDVKAVNFYRRLLPGVDRYELMMAFHTSWRDAEDALNRADTCGHFVDGVSFGRGHGLTPREWTVLDHFEES